MYVVSIRNPMPENKETISGIEYKDKTWFITTIVRIENLLKANHQYNYSPCGTLLILATNETINVPYAIIIISPSFSNLHTLSH